MTDDLVQLHPGSWERRSLVFSVEGYPGSAAVLNWRGRVVEPATVPCVQVRLTDGRKLRWECDSWDEARDMADKIGRIVSGQTEPDDKDPEEAPEAEEVPTLRVIGGMAA